MYEEMKYCINSIVEKGIVRAKICKEHDGFKEWNRGMTSRDHPSIVQVLLERGKDIDEEGNDFPSLVYVSREKRPRQSHNFKAGALNVLIWVSSLMSNVPFILTLDSDMYVNNCESLREAICFFMNPPTGHQFAFVQFPQKFNGITKNDLYCNHLRRYYNFHLKGMDGIEGPLYVGTRCIHRRDVLCGSKPQKFSQNFIKELIASSKLSVKKAEELAKSDYEKNTQWGKKVDMLYDCVVEDVLTGYSIHCKGWKSVFCSPKRDAFLGCASVNLNNTLTQIKRWAMGLLEIFASKFCPLTCGIRHSKKK